MVKESWQSKMAEQLDGHHQDKIRTIKSQFNKVMLCRLLTISIDYCVECLHPSNI